jgi:hypothetical protein
VAVAENDRVPRFQSFQKFKTRIHRVDAEDDGSKKFAIRNSKSEILLTVLCVPSTEFILSGVEAHRTGRCD